MTNYRTQVLLGLWLGLAACSATRGSLQRNAKQRLENQTASPDGTVVPMGRMELKLSKDSKRVDGNALAPSSPNNHGLSGTVENAYPEPVAGAILEVRQDPVAELQGGALSPEYS